MTLTSLAAANLLRRPVRTGLSVLGVGVGIGALVAFVSLARGFREQFARIFASTGAELVVQQRGSADPEHSTLTDDDVARLRTVPGVAEVCPSTFTFVRHNGQPFPVLGREPGSRLMRKYRIVEGAGLAPGRDDEVIVGRSLADLHRLRVGDALTLRDRPFRIAGRFEMAEIPLENACAIASLRAVKDLMKGEDRVHIAFVYLADPRETDAAAAAIAAAHPGLEVLRSSEYTDKGLRQQLDTAEHFAWAISAMALAVAAIVVLLVMLTNVNERTREIGTLRALGWSRRAVVGLVLHEGLLLCLLGAAAGAALGVAGAEAVAHGWRQGWLYAHYTPELFAQALGVAFGLGLAGAAYPAWRAAGLAPVEALRYE
jgi:putative ABC transport system permease protein